MSIKSALNSFLAIGQALSVAHIPTRVSDHSFDLLVCNGYHNNYYTIKALVVSPEGRCDRIDHVSFDTLKRVKETYQLAREGDWVFAVKTMRNGRSEANIFQIMNQRLYPIAPIGVHPANQAMISLKPELANWLHGGFNTPDCYPVSLMNIKKPDHHEVTTTRHQHMLDDLDRIGKEMVIRHGITSCNAGIKMLHRFKDYLTNKDS